jgi:osmotically-inducible protein OsmY
MITAFVLGAGTLSVGATQARAKVLSDWAITTAVENEIAHDPAVSLNAITVRTDQGVVRLTGKVSNLLIKERAATLAETVKGVRSVINRLQIEPILDRSDAGIRRDVQTALFRDPATKSWKIQASVNDSVVTLTGTVHSWAHQQLAAKVAKGVSGVTGINNRIQIRYRSQRSDYQIEQEVEKRLRWDALVDSALIRVNVQDGVVKLSGTVGTAVERTRASVDSWVAGVKSVDTSALQVKDWAKDPMERKREYIAASDAKIKSALDTALAYDPRVFSFNVYVHVRDGLVTLRGTVDNLKAKRAAERVARHTVGVLRVYNRLKVRPSTPTDSEITNAVNDAMIWDPFVDAHEITVTVKNGSVYLKGKVDSYFEKGRADDVASRIYGVVAVVNRLKVDNGRAALAYNPFVDEIYIYDADWYDYQPFNTFKSDRKIKEDIESELYWNPFVYSGNVKVTVENGVVTLRGEVPSWTSYDAAMEEAYEGGATWVQNRLRVNPPQKG